MKTTDLMIGDWVLQCELNTPVKVQSIMRHYADESIYFYHEAREYISNVYKLEPIPLTPEILEKNGFIRRLFSSGKICGWYLEKDLAEEYYMIDVTYNNDKLYIEIHGSATIENYCDYVHELQHALKICGIEKEIVV